MIDSEAVESSDTENDDAHSTTRLRPNVPKLPPIQIKTFTQRPKWLGNQENLQIGDLVLVKTENFKTGSWCLGRVFNVHPGADGVVRVVTVKTRSGMCRRGVNKLARLPLD
uniref:Uncharacterized protein n=1 Tax=Phlebotomus papatasi TaxID=29031 RepID=A0A1B0DAH6_PHLPP